jgi:protocatechuate 3,4-dioxygenase beta subunit
MRIERLALLLILCCVSSFAGSQVANDPGEPGVITGTVIDSDGHPLRNARVYVKEHSRPQTGAVRCVTTDQDGKFRLVNLRHGDYDVFAVPSDSTSIVSRWRQHVHLPKEKPIGNVTFQWAPPHMSRGTQVPEYVLEGCLAAFSSSVHKFPFLEVTPLSDY